MGRITVASTLEFDKSNEPNVKSEEFFNLIISSKNSARLSFVPFERGRAIKIENNIPSGFQVRFNRINDTFTYLLSAQTFDASHTRSIFLFVSHTGKMTIIIGWLNK